MIKHIFSGVVDADAVARARDFLSANAGQPVDLEINSVGGGVFDGLEMSHAVAAHGNVHAINSGIVASAATFAFIAAKRRTMKAGTMLMIHGASAMAIGPADVHRATADVLDKIDNEMTNLYAARSKQPRAKIAKLLSDETWLTGSEAVALGLADHAEAQPPKASAAAIAASIGDIPTNFDQHKFAAALARANARSAPMPEVTNELDDAETVIRKIYVSCEAGGLDLKASNKIVQAAKGDLNVARDLIISAVAAKNQYPATIPTDHSDNSGPDGMVAAVESAIYHRMAGTPVPANDPAQQFQGRSLLDIGAALITANGGKVRSWDRTRLANQIVAEAGRHSTSDFPAILGNAAQRQLGEAYLAAQTPLTAIAKRRTANDFRSLIIARLGEMPELKVVGEGGEVTYGTRTEAKESFKLSTYARIFAITRNALINDDLGAFSDSVKAWGQAAANVEADQLVALITGGGVVMDDGEQLFSAAHGNAIDVTLSSVANLSTARKKMRDQTGLDGRTRINIAPKFLVVGSALETIGEALVTAITPTTVSEVNVFVDKLQVLVEPRLDDTEWFLFGDPAQAEVLAYAYLGDAAGPQIETKDGWTVLGLETRCVFDYGAGITGWRGAVGSSGETS